MPVQAWDETERAELLAAHADALRRYSEARADGRRDDARPYFAEAKKLKAAYFGRIPRVVMATCPFCRKELLRSFDPFGLDGLWWQRDAEPEELPACTHFCVVRGALSYGNHAVIGGASEVHPGPEVPYVIPRLLTMPGMRMVIGQLAMAPGYTAYPLVYFAEKRPPVQELTADWARKLFRYRKPNGEEGWDLPSDLWEFDLGPYLAADQIWWSPPGSENGEVTQQGVCPFENLPGRREEIAVQGSDCWTIGLPDGEPWQPSE